jgi:hypothetical protein
MRVSTATLSILRELGDKHARAVLEYLESRRGRGYIAVAREGDVWVECPGGE